MVWGTFFMNLDVFPISKRRDGREGETRYELLSLRANLPRAAAPSPIVEMKNCHGGLKIRSSLRIVTAA